MCIDAPPGYAKIVSTPSRIRHSTRISAPLMVTPRSGVADFVVASVVLVGVLIGVVFSWKKAAKLAAGPPLGKLG